MNQQNLENGKHMIFITSSVNHPSLQKFKSYMKINKKNLIEKR